MDTYHAKSPCCGVRGRRFGTRRRQCTACHTTWRVRKKRRGRKRRRALSGQALKYLRHELPSLYARSRYRHLSLDKLKRHLRLSRDRFLTSTPWPALPFEPPLVAIADAMVQCVEGIWYTIYFILIRKAKDHTALIVAPYARKGMENYEGWQKAFVELPPGTAASIKAIVCDGRVGLLEYAHEKKWLIQRCHFHLLARLQGRRSRRRYSRHFEEGVRLYRLIGCVLTEPQEATFQHSLVLIDAAAKTAPSKELRHILSGFVKHYRDYRTYLMYPHLRLPHTSNAVESVIGSIRALCHRARGFRTFHSLLQWIEAFLKSKKYFTCNGYHQPN